MLPSPWFLQSYLVRAVRTVRLGRGEALLACGQLHTKSALLARVLSIISTTLEVNPRPSCSYRLSYGSVAASISFHQLLCSTLPVACKGRAHQPHLTVHAGVPSQKGQRRRTQRKSLSCSSVRVGGHKGPNQRCFILLPDYDGSTSCRIKLLSGGGGCVNSA